MADISKIMGIELDVVSPPPAPSFVWLDHLENGDNWGVSDPSNNSQFADSEFQIISNPIQGVASLSSLIAAVPWRLVGDFDIQFSLNMHSYVNAALSYTTCSVYESGFGSASARLRLIPVDSGNQFFVRLVDSGVNHDLDPETTQGNYKFRFVRSGSAIRAYYWTNSQWEWDGDTAGHLCSGTYDLNINVATDIVIASPTDYIVIGLDYVGLVTGTRAAI